jgi:uncharacterized membrane protein
MNEQLEMIVVLYVHPKEADARYQELRASHIRNELHAVDAGVLVKDEHGKATIQEEDDLEGREGRQIGLIVGGLLGLALGPAGLAGLVGAGVSSIAGAIAGGLTAGAIDSGIKNSTFQQILDSMPPSSSALVVVSAAKYRQSVVHIIDAPQAKMKRYAMNLSIGEEIIER